MFDKMVMYFMYFRAQFQSKFHLLITHTGQIRWMTVMLPALIQIFMQVHHIIEQVVLVVDSSDWVKVSACKVTTGSELHKLLLIPNRMYRNKCILSPNPIGFTENKKGCRSSLSVAHRNEMKQGIGTTKCSNDTRK